MILNYNYRIYPDAKQQSLMQEWLEICRQVYNYSLREVKDWLSSRKCSIEECSLEKEYIIPTDVPFPSYHLQQDALPQAKKKFPYLAGVHSQVLQTTVRRLHDTWDSFQKREFGFPRFKKFGQIKSFVFPQFKKSPIIGNYVDLPKIGMTTINLHRPIPSGFEIKQVRVVRKADRWYANITIQCNVEIPEPMPQGHPIGVDTGLEKFLATSDGILVRAPKFFKSLQSKLKLLSEFAV